MELKGLTIACLGDSMTEGLGASSSEKVWHQLLSERCGMKACLNYGVSSTSIGVGKELADKNFIKRVDTMADDVDAVIVFGGINDYGEVPLGSFSDRIDTTFYGACHILMKKLLEKYPQKPILFMTPFHISPKWVKEQFKSLTRDVVKDYADAIKETACYYSIPVLDLYSTSGMNPAVKEQEKLYFYDGLHPNDAGYEKLSYKVEAFLKNM